jgi:hypothetical protein
MTPEINTSEHFLSTLGINLCVLTDKKLHHPEGSYWNEHLSKCLLFDNEQAKFREKHSIMS